MIPDQETGAGYNEPVLVENSYWALINQYNWAITENTESGPTTWSSDGIEYNLTTDPFYQVLTGRVATPYLRDPGHESTITSSAGPQKSSRDTVASGVQGPIFYPASHFWIAGPDRNGLSLRCLTQ